MTVQRTCETCGTTLPEGMESCPRCLLGIGLEPPPRDPSPSEENAGAAATGEPPVETAAEPVATEPSAEELSALFPNLEVLERIGMGGMGVVYKARQPTLDRLVALKILRPEAARAPGFAERFMREARTLAHLSHPSIVGIHDFGETEGTYWLLMEFVDGVDLRQLMKSGELTPQRALGLVSQICDALQFAHDEGVVHRDIKPENVLLDRRGDVKIADFGLAKLAVKGPADATLTRTDQVMGTPRYMAPEQLRSSQDVDHRADIYALGVVLYEMLTGELPVGHFPPPSQQVAVDVKLDTVVLRTLEREPELRYQQVSDIKTDIAEVQGHAASPSTRAPVPTGGSPAASADESNARISGEALFIGVCFFPAAWMAMKFTMSFDGLSGFVLGWVLLVVAVAVTLKHQLMPYPSLREELRSGGRRRMAMRAVAALLLFSGGFLFFCAGILEDWDRGTPDYATSRASEQLAPDLYQSTVAELLPKLGPRAGSSELGELDVNWHTPGVPGALLLEHRPARVPNLMVGALLFFLAVLALVFTDRFGTQWRLCGQHVVRIPLLLFFGLAVTLGLQWMRSLDDPALSRKPVAFAWNLDAGLDAVYAEVDAFLAEEGYHVHARLVGTVRTQPGRKKLALYGQLGAEHTSPFARWRMLSDGPHRTKPHLLFEIVGALDQRGCVVKVDAGALREELYAERWTLWLGTLEQRLRALGG